MRKFRELGVPVANTEGALGTSRARSILRVIRRHSQFRYIESRRVIHNEEPLFDAIIADCILQEIGKNNAAGIKGNERIALCISLKSDSEPAVYPLREDFPVDLPHLNTYQRGFPPKLCISQLSWEISARSWTAQKFLADILRWFTCTANGNLHAPDQAVEQIYFEPEQTIILPSKFEQHIKDPDTSLILMSTDASDGDHKFLCALYIKDDVVRPKEMTTDFVIVLEIAPITHGKVEHIPLTLGDLDMQIARRGGSLIDALFQQLHKRMSGNSIELFEENCLLILSIPIRRSQLGPVERRENRAYSIPTSRLNLCLKMGLANRDPESGKYFVDNTVGQNPKVKDLGWGELELITLGIRSALDEDFSQNASGINLHTAKFNGILAGVGALGSALADIWSRNCWGTWTYIDHDYLEPHNLVRHIATYEYLGYAKTKAVKIITGKEHAPGDYEAQSIVSRATCTENLEIQAAFEKASFWVDVTTTLEVPRTIALRSNSPRGCSAFVTPTGRDSVLILESSDKSIRLDVLEAQYYRAILNCKWGDSHLDGHSGGISIGAGCRDMSLIMSIGTIRLHASILAQQIQNLRDRSEAGIRIWVHDPETGSVTCEIITIQRPISRVCRNWKVHWDKAINAKLNILRNIKLPLETGGIILGYVDYVSYGIYVVDVTSAPTDSIETGNEFVRGIEGLVDIRNKSFEKTAGIVDYIGEWHSHPQYCSVQPSHHDHNQQTELAQELSQIGQPLLTMIVGDNSIHVQVTENI